MNLNLDTELPNIRSNRSRESRFATFLASVLTLLCFSIDAVVAQGQKLPTGPGKVLEAPSIPGSRSGDDYEPLGVRLGGFLLHPYFDIEYLRDDNVFARSDEVESDSITVLRPGFNLDSKWSTHEFNVYGASSIGRYSDFDSEDYDNWVIGAAARIDVDRNRRFRIGLEMDGQKEDRASPDSVLDSESPTDTDTTVFSANWLHSFNRLYYRLGGVVRDLDFNNSSADVDNRDRKSNRLFGEVGYEFSPGYSAFLRLENDTVDYETLDKGRDRDSDGQSLVGGVGFDLTDIIEGSVFAGYRKRDFNDALLNDISGGLIGARLDWQLTGLTTLTIDADRTIEETTVEGSSGYYRTRFGVDAEHELYRNVILEAGIGIYDDDYEGSARKDDGFNWHFGGTYVSNRWLRVHLGFAHEDRDSNAEDVITSDYDRDVFRILLRGIR